jgi:hypothetical protein
MNRSLLLKTLSLFAGLLFATFSWVQYNDIDPEIYDRPSVLDAAGWLAFYALVAFLFGWALFRSVPKWLLSVAVVVCVVQLGRTAPGMWENLTGEAPFTLTQSGMSSSDPRVELSREFLGAIIALVSLAGLWLAEKGRGGKESKASGS